MTTQPEALRLAALIQSRYGNDINDEAAAELRRLHGLNGELLEALKFYGSSCDATESTPCGYEGNLCCKRARAAIAKAEGQA
jgi:hypothetical protein